MPSVTYEPAIFEKTVSALEDGTWYFRIRAREAGTWSTVSSYRLNIDSAPPILSGYALSYDASLRAVMITATAEDAGSSVAGFEVSADGKDPESLDAQAFSEGPYAFAYTKPGKHQITLTVRDQAGNTSEMTDMVIVPESLVDTPIVTIAGISLSLLQLLALMGVVSIISLIVAILSLYGFFRRRKHAPSLVAVERDVHRGFALYKKELEKNLRILERARESRNLTTEETKLHKRMLENLSDLERYIAGRIEESE